MQHSNRAPSCAGKDSWLIPLACLRLPNLEVRRSALWPAWWSLVEVPYLRQEMEDVEDLRHYPWRPFAAIGSRYGAIFNTYATLRTGSLPAN